MTSPENVIWYQNVDSRASLSPNNESIIPLVTNSGYPWQDGRLLLLLWRIPSPNNRNKLHADRLCSVLRRPGSRQADAIEIDITATDHRRYCQVCVGTLTALIADLYPPPPLPPPGPTQGNVGASDSEESSDGDDSNPSVDDSHLPNHRIPSQNERARRRAVLDELALHLARPGSGHWSSIAETEPNDRIQLDPRQVSPCAMRLARLERPDPEHQSNSDDVNEMPWVD